MVYVSNGQVLDSRTRSPWSLSFLSDLFWGAVEFIGLFPPGFPGRRRMGRINHGAGPTPPPMGGGG